MINEKEEEARLGREELELRISSMTSSEGNKENLLQNLEASIVALNANKAEMELKAKDAEAIIKDLELRLKDERRKLGLADRKSVV